MLFLIVVLLLAVLYILLSERGSVPSIGKLGRRRIILDSCALIDGRIVELVRTGFVADELVIPRFILSELQMLADGNDSHKRERARFGLEVAAELQEYSWAHVSVSQTNFPGISATDDKLVKLAKKMHGVLCTTDYNLNKVAAVEGVRTLNVNELSQGLRPIVLPGEEITVKIVQRGSSADQGVGYLDDGTMIVVDGAGRAVNSTVKTKVDRMHQTVAGKMVFAHLIRDVSRQQPASRAASQGQRGAQQKSQSAAGKQASKQTLKSRLVKPKPRSPGVIQ